MIAINEKRPAPDLPVVELFERNDAGGIEVNKVPPGVKLVVKKYFEEDEEEPSEEILNRTWEEDGVCHNTQVLEDDEGKYWLHMFWAKQPEVKGYEPDQITFDEAANMPILEHLWFCPLCERLVPKERNRLHLNVAHLARTIVVKGENNDDG